MDTDLTGKKVAPFFNSGSQPISDPIQVLSEWLPRESVNEALSMSNSPRDDIEESINRWIEDLTFEE